MLRPFLLAIPALLLASGCDNVGRAFDPVVGPPGGAITSTIEVPPAGGDLRDGRPVVRAVYPTGGGWPTTVPVVLEFSESVNQASLLPTTPGGTDAHVIVRVQGTTQPLPASYDFVANGRLLVLRPVGLTNAQNASYEVVLLPGGRDADGVRFNNSVESVLAVFTVDAPENDNDGRILALFPRDNQRDIARGTDVIAVFTRPANASTITADSFHLSAGGSTIPAELTLPVSTAGIDDARILRLNPTGELAGLTEHQLTVTSAIQFGTSGVLQFNGRTPFARFTTAAVPTATGVSVGNPTPGFPDKINRANLANLQIAVDVPADALTGDRVVARIYGGDAQTTATGDLVFVERAVNLATDGAQTVALDFTGALGSLTRPHFDDGTASLVAQLQRGQTHSGIVRGSSSARFDTSVPTIVTIGPPGPGGTSTDAFTDQEALALFGTASEALGAARLDPGTEDLLFASATDGRFLLRPVPLGRLRDPQDYTLHITDLAGNEGTAPITGRIVQRGLVTGTITDTLTVDVYDDATLLAVQGATVLVELGPAQVPPVGRLRAVTDQQGRATFAVTPGNHTITVVQTGYHLTTLYDTGAAFASLPLQALADDRATLLGTAGLVTPAPNTTVLVSSNAFADTFDVPAPLAVQTTASQATTIPPTKTLPARPQVLTALSGVFDPASGTFTGHACQMLGSTLTTPTPPSAPPAPGAEFNVSLVLLPTVSALIGDLGVAQTEDFGGVNGLDFGNLVAGDPRVRLTMSLRGFGGQSLFGVGLATPTGVQPHEFSLTGKFSLPIVGGLEDFQSAAWLVTELRDQAGNLTRHRALVTVQPLNLLDVMDPQSIPVVTPGTAGPAPSVLVDDVLDPPAVAGSLGMLEVVARDASASQRQWTILLEDADPAAGTKTVQFPDLTGETVTGLAAGTWSVRAEARLFAPVTLSYGPGDFVLAERRRHEVGFSRSAPVQVTAQ